MQLFYGFQSAVQLIIGIVAFVAEVFAFVDALRNPERAYLAAGKRTRTFWLVLLGVAVAIGFATVLAILLEAGKFFLRYNTPAISDIMLAPCGAWIGCWLAGRVVDIQGEVGLEKIPR